MFRSNRQGLLARTGPCPDNRLGEDGGIQGVHILRRSWQEANIQINHGLMFRLRTGLDEVQTGISKNKVQLSHRKIVLGSN